MSQLQTLRQALTRVHLRVTVFAVGMAGLTVLLAGFATMRGYAQQNLALIAQTASYNVAPALVFDDRDAAKEALRPLAQTQGVSALTVVRSDGVRFASIDRNGPALNWRAKTLSVFAPESIVAPIFHNGRTIGTITVRGDASAIADYVAFGLLGALTCLVLTALAAWALAGRLQASIINQLQGIARTAHAVRVDRDLKARAPAAEIAEIAALSDDFNGLLDELEAQHRQLQHENAALSHLAAHDPLTDLHNRPAFERRLAFAIDKAQQAHENFAVLYIDCDRFKGVNDTHGHHVGDQVLRAMASALKASLFPGDSAARLGGDEFAALLAAPSNAAEARRTIAAIEARLRDGIVLPNELRVSIGASCGFAIYPDDGDDVATLLRKADKAMYRMKATRQTAPVNASVGVA